MRDKEFIRDKVPMTKQEVRAISLDFLSIEKGKKMLDIGGGTGSVSIDASMKNPDLSIDIIEHKDLAVDLIYRNIAEKKIANINVIKDKAPIIMQDKYDRVFVGGSGGNLCEILDWITDDLLTDDGILVLNFILLDNLMKTLEYFDKKTGFEIEGCSVNVSRLDKLAGKAYFKPNNLSYIICARRENDE